MDTQRLSSAGIKVTTITDTIHVVHGNNRSRSPFANAVLVLDKTFALFDTGCGLDIMETLARQIPIDVVITSHSHPDHTSGTWLLQEIRSPEIVVPQERAESIHRADALALRFVEEDLADLWKNTYLPVTGFRDFIPTGTYSHGHEFSFGNTRFIAVHTPGHLDDHYCLYEPDKKIVVGFDIDLSPFGPWYGNPESDIVRFRNSIETIRSLPTEVYIPSHAKPLRAPYIEKRMLVYEMAFEDRDTAVLACISQTGTTRIEDIVLRSPIYQADHSRPDEILKYGETQMVTKHLVSLEQKGLVTRLDGGFIKTS